MTFVKFAKIIISPIYKLFFPVHIEGLENFDMENPFVLCANHQSNWDVVALYVASPRDDLKFMAKEELFRFKPLGWLVSKLGAFPVKRGQNDLGAIKTALRVLKDGEVLGIFPQGKRSETIEEDSAKAGAVLIASKSKVNILPAAIDTEYKLFKPVKIRFGKPFVVCAEDRRLTMDEIQEKANELMKEIIALKKGEQE
ncbi:MAG: 1-acyl-sn-glycerol-3-phosphate acyltransferase [Clostridia bacterium]|nr:1-acyl-sn-glycerol-3-phosphate acyltransferase [Clostridia bacterium]